MRLRDLKTNTKTGIICLILLFGIGLPSTSSSPVVESANCSSVQLSWDPTTDNGSPITLYTLRYRAISPANEEWVELNTTGTRLTVGGLRPGGVYHVGVAALNGVGGGAFSDSTVVVTTIPGKCLLAMGSYYCYTPFWYCRFHL